MPHYSFTAPEAGGWYIRRHGGEAEHVELRRESGSVVISIWTYWSPILDPALKAMTAREVADLVRETERRIMVERGVRPGLYELSDLRMGESAIADRVFYTMDYRTRAESVEQFASLYLSFPRERGNEAFFAALYWVAAPPGQVAEPDMAALLELLETLEMPLERIGQ
jgi:hypothetical protein